MMIIYTLVFLCNEHGPRKERHRKVNESELMENMNKKKISVCVSLQVIEYINRAVTVLRTQSQLLANHPNANLYNSLASLVEFDGYYLESEPCLVCNNPEVPFSSVKLSTVKVLEGVFVIMIAVYV